MKQTVLGMIYIWSAQWQHQAIAHTNVYKSDVRSCGMHLRAVLPEVPSQSLSYIILA